MALETKCKYICKDYEEMISPSSTNPVCKHEYDGACKDHSDIPLYETKNSTQEAVPYTH